MNGTNIKPLVIDRWNSLKCNCKKVGHPPMSFRGLGYIYVNYSHRWLFKRVLTSPLNPMKMMGMMMDWVRK